MVPVLFQKVRMVLVPQTKQQNPLQFWSIPEIKIIQVLVPKYSLLKSIINCQLTLNSKTFKKTFIFYNSSSGFLEFLTSSLCYVVTPFQFSLVFKNPFGHFPN